MTAIWILYVKLRSEQGDETASEAKVRLEEEEYEQQMEEQGTAIFCILFSY